MCKQFVGWQIVWAAFLFEQPDMSPKSQSFKLLKKNY